MTNLSESSIPSNLLPLERSLDEALRAYLERLAVFVEVVVISGAVCFGILYGKTKVGFQVPADVILVGVLLIQNFLFMHVLRAEKKDRRRIVERYEQLVARLDIRPDGGARARGEVK